MTADNNKVINNSEILFIYEAKLCNPNGDPDDENKPRIDPKTRINLVSDVRLKRFFRNYIIDIYGEDKIWVSTVNGSHVDATERLDALKTNNESDVDDENKPRIDPTKIVLNKCIDARLFGATIPLKGDRRGARGETHSIIGPVQFSWGFSLHPVELVDSATITSMFKGRETEAEAGTMGKDWRLYYSLIAFYGVISGMRAKNSSLTNNDIKILDNMLWESMVMDATTRSKIGHTPHLYMRIEYKNNNYLHGDLRRYVKVGSSDRPIRKLEDLTVKLDALVNQLNNMELIDAIYIRTSQDFNNILNNAGRLTKQPINLPHNNIDITSLQ
ncbi:MAG: type I-B CRISPR-associated protein Cas7/Csh2 [Candidatus Nitrosocaldaceae archaeon]